MARVEDVLAEPSSVDCILKCFSSAKANSFENILDPLLKIVRTSMAVTIGLAKPEFFQRLTDRLSHHKAVVRLNLLKLLKAVCDIHPDRASLVERFGLYDVVERLSRTDVAVLVRELARDIVPILLPGATGALLARANASLMEPRPVMNRSAGALLDMNSFDDITKGRRGSARGVTGEPIFLPRRPARRTASEVSSSPPMRGGSPQLHSPDSSLFGEGPKRVRPVPVQRRSMRDSTSMLGSNGVNSDTDHYLPRGTSGNLSESKLLPRKPKP